MTRYIAHIKILLYRVGILILLFSLSRLVFHLFNVAHFQIDSFSDLFHIYFYGIKYDLVIICIANVFFIIAHAIPGNFKEYFITQRILKIYYILINGVFISLNFVDTKYFDFTNKRSTTDLFKLMGTSEDVWQLIPLFIKDYWYLILLWMAFMVIVWFVYPNIDVQKSPAIKNTQRLKTTLIQFGILIIILCLTFIGARGSLKLKPLRTINAADYTSAQNIPLVLNSPFTLIKSINKNEIEKVNYLPENELKKYITVEKVFKNDSAFTYNNIVIIIMESFANEYIGAFNDDEGYTPYLDTLIQNSIAFPNAFANGKKSIEAVPSVLLGLPSLMDNPYITSSFATNNIRSIADILKPFGYYSAFFHGGKNGTMGFDKFVKLAGFDDYFGLNEYPYYSDFDGGWGIYDEPFFEFFANKMTEIEKPFITCFFSLSSHHPYHIPEKYQNKFSKGVLKIHESIGYADFALHSFFEYAKKLDWFTNTLFIITADHTAQLATQRYNNSVGNYKIPIIYYAPDDSIIKIDSSITQQIDILPSVLDFLNYNGTEVLFGNSIWKNNSTFTVNFKNGIYQIIDDTFVLKFDGEKVIGFQKHSDDFISLYPLNTIRKVDPLEFYNAIKRREQLELQLKAFIQEYNSRLIENKMVINEK